MLENRYSVVSFDFFDTVINRKCIFPKNIFIEIENEIGLPGWAEERVLAEESARKKAANLGKEEVTLIDIYSTLNTPEVMALEIKKELNNWILSKNAVELLRHYFNRGLRVLVISDFYFPGDILRQYLDDNQIPFHQLYCSSDLGITKRTGNLYDFIAASERLEFRSWRHYGDNYQSDGISANYRGIDAIHWWSTIELIKHFLDRDHVDQELLELIAIAFVDLCGETTPTFEEVFSRFYILPIALGYVNWIFERRSRSIRGNYIFLGRDSWVFYLIARRLFSENNDLHYFRVSRRSLLALNSTSDFRKNLRYFNNHTIREVIEAINVDEDIQSELCENLFIRNYQSDQIWTESEVALSSLVEKSLMKQALREKESLETYLDFPSKFLREGSHLVDIGWHGTFHKDLEEALGTPINAYFLGLYPEINHPSHAKGYLFDSSHGREESNDIRLAIELIEIIFSEAAPSVLKYTKVDGKPSEVFKIKDLDNLASAHHSINMMHESIINLFNVVEVELLLTCIQTITPELMARHLARLTSQPTSKESFHFEKFPVSVAIGASKEEPLLSFGSSRWLPAHKYLTLPISTKVDEAFFFRLVWRAMPIGFKKYIKFVFWSLVNNKMGKTFKRYLPTSVKMRLKRIILGY